LIVAGGFTKDGYEGLGFSIHDITHAISHLTHQITNHVIPKPLRGAFNKAQSALERFGGSVNKDFQKVKKWAQDHRKTLQIVAAAALTAGAAAYFAGGWAALGSAVAHGAGVVGSGLAHAGTWIGGALTGHTATAIMGAVAPTLIQGILAKQAAGQQLSAAEQSQLAQAEAAQALAAQQGMYSGGGGGGGGFDTGTPFSGSLGPDPFGMPPGNNPEPKAMPKPSIPPVILLAGAGLLLYALTR